jgi:predicted nucleic acid-binding protein
MTKRVICDTNVHDAVAVDPGFKRLIERAVADGHIALSTTHVQLTELSKIPPRNDIGQASAIGANRTGTAVFVLDYSRLDEDRLGTPQTNAAFEAIRQGNPRHTEDAMIGATAFADADILVTDDTKFRKRFEALNSPVEVMSSVEFASYITHILS